MVHFITRKDLITWLENHCTRRAVVRAIQEGTVENLGLFVKVGPEQDLTGWILRVISESERMWIVEVIRYRTRYGIYISSPAIFGIPWQNWCGPDSELYGGDNQQEYTRKRDEQRQKIRSETISTESTESRTEPESEGA